MAEINLTYAAELDLDYDELTILSAAIRDEMAQHPPSATCLCPAIRAQKEIVQLLAERPPR